jgi:hypothetical protein
MTSSRVVPHVAPATVEGGPGRLTAHGHVAWADTAVPAPFDPLGTPEGTVCILGCPKTFELDYFARLPSPIPTAPGVVSASIAAVC